MKNLYLLPTDKPSRIMLRHGKLFFFKDDDSVPKGSPKNQHIYIISDDEIKHGDFVISMVNDVIEVAKISMMVACSYNGLEHCKKIVLTTDQDLIQDGIQSIPDEFLEWFVNNPSCEEVKIKPLLSNNGRALFGYKIIIPKEDLVITAIMKFVVVLLENKKHLKKLQSKYKKIVTNLLNL